MILGSIFEILYLPEVISTEQGVGKAVAQLAMTKILPFTLSIALIKAVWEFFKENKHMGIEIEELVRIGFLSLFLVTYNPAMNLFNDIVMGTAAEYEYNNAEIEKEVIINQVMQRARELMPNLSSDKLSQLRGALTGDPEDDAEILMQLKAEYDGSNGDSEDTWSFMDAGPAIGRMVGQLNNMASNWMMMGISGIVGKGGTLIAQSVMWVVIIIFGMVLRAIGPLAIALSFVFKGQLKNWFMTFAAAKCAIITTMIVEGIVTGMMAAFHSDSVMTMMGIDAVDDMNPLGTMMSTNLILAMNIVIVICFVMVFYFTSKWIGSEDGGKVLSMAAGAAMSAASGGVKGMQSLMSKMASKGVGGAGGPSAGGGGDSSPSAGG